ncbi:excinuclease ABC subunit UvrB [Patescibacteria group bacterium]
MFKLKSQFKPTGDQPKAIEKLSDGITKGHKHQTLLGVTGSGKTFTVANVVSKFKKPVLVIAPNKTLAAQLYSEYKSFFPENKVCYFVSYYDYYQPEAYMPVSDTYIEKESSINDEIDKLRHEATSALLTRRDVIIVASVSCIYNLGVPAKYLDSTLTLTIGMPITRGDLIKQLIKIQFERNNIIPKRGQFRVRGDTFEVMPASEETVYKIILDDQKVASISVVDSLTRKEKNSLQRLDIFPPKHFITPELERVRAIKDIREEMNERLKYFEKNNLYIENERLEKRTRQDIEMIKRMGYCHGIENYSRHLSGKLAGEAPETLLSYFGRAQDFITVIDESHLAVPQIRGMFAGDKSRKNVLIEHGWRLPSALDNRPLNFSEFEKRTGQTIFTSATPGEFEYNKSVQIVDQVIRPTGLVDPEITLRSVYNKDKDESQVDDLMKEIKHATAKKERVIVTTLTKKMSEELADFLKRKGIKACYMHSDIKTLERVDILNDFREGKYDVLVGINLLREGLDLPEVAVVAILDADREGFLRNHTSLIQTIGRAARNINSRVILYADVITKSIKQTVRETNRRRKIQLEHNKKHGIEPKGISKETRNLMKVKKE